MRHRLRGDYQAVLRSSHPLGDWATPDSRGVDIILHPTAIQTAPILPKDDTPATTPEYAQDLLTVPASLAGLPCLSVPYGTADADGWPVGVSLTGQWGMEGLVMDVARVGVESLTQGE